MAKKVFGEEDIYTATTLNNLALLYYEQGKDEQAEPLCVRALAICEGQLGPQHPNTLTVRGNYIGLLRKLGRNEEAAQVEARGVEM